MYILTYSVINKFWVRPDYMDSLRYDLECRIEIYRVVYARFYFQEGFLSWSGCRPYHIVNKL